MENNSNGINRLPNTSLPEVKLNDRFMRLLGIPFFGIIIPNVSGLFGSLTVNDLNYWLGYPYFIVLSAIIWQGNRYLMFRTRKRFTWFDKPIEKLILLVVNNIFFTTPLTVAWLCLWYRWAGFEKVNWEVILIVSLINVICVLFVIHIYETVFMVKEQENEQLINANLSSAKAKAELEALKNQIDPHFMFNSLNSLSYLISTNPPKATQFTEHLADIYRYILSQKDQTLVPLEDELNFTRKYIDLLELRFGKALTVTKYFNGTTEKEYLIPPISAFVVMENAVKHNEISEGNPLEVDIHVKDNMLVISNKIQVKRSIRHSSKIGLKNMDDRFRIITGKGIAAANEDGRFNVTLPLIPLSR
jgi:sensor histidine kinase YesM